MLRFSRRNLSQIVLVLLVLYLYFLKPQTKEIIVYNESSEYYLDFQPFSATKTFRQKMLSTAIDSALKLPESPFVPNINDWNAVTRLTTLADLSLHPETFSIVLLDPSTTDPFLPPKRYNTLPKYHGIMACYRMYWSEYPFIRREGYRCVKDLHSATPSPTWPHDTPPFACKYNLLKKYQSLLLLEMRR